MRTLFTLGVAAALLIGADLLATHLLLPQERFTSTLSQETYRLLIVKWFLAGIGLGMVLMFCLVESWIWNNWRSWNRYCCDWHEKIYKSEMGISQGKMLRR